MGHPLTVVPYCISHFAFHTIHLLKIICAFWEGTWAFPCLWFHLTFHISHFTSHTIHLLKINCAFWEGTWAFPCLWFHLIFHISHLTFHISHHSPSKNHLCFLGRHVGLPLPVVPSDISHFTFHISHHSPFTIYHSLFTIHSHFTLITNSVHPSFRHLHHHLFRIDHTNANAKSKR